MAKQSLWVSIFGALIATSSYGQYAGDVFRYSEINQNGTARFQSLGGNHAALGGDASSIFGNPAGLGFYNRSEVSISPGLNSISNKASYIDNSVSSAKTKGNLAQASLVISSQPGFQRKWKRSSLGISFSRQQSFQDVYNYSGFDNRSSYLDNVVQNVNRSGTSTAQLDADFESDPSNGGPLAYSVPAAYYQMYLINPGTAAGPTYSALDQNSAVDQYGTYVGRGANTQWTVAYAGNYNDKLYVGGNVGFSRIRYEYERTFEDQFVDSPELISIRQREALTVTGNGVNLSLGVIYKFNPMLQVGGVLTTPTWSAIKETFSQGVDAAFVDGLVTGPEGDLITPPYTSLNVAPNDFEYSIVSPFRGSAGITAFLQDKGFITGTLEYVGYSGMNVRTNYLDDAGNTAFRNDTKTEIQDTYRNVVNVRVGGEYRVSAFRGRLGFGYLADPYLNNDGLNRQKLLFSAGVGVRKNRFFADLSGTLMIYKSAYTPYFLNNAQDYSSVEISNKPVNVVLSVGTFF
ncbi:hypothetical protein [Dyadobacter bucti]|uniref:hypothetical protein n=1 Tax=Dyadobacter bucti TaxID=2572203 RepID=UPI003F6E9C05